MPTKPIKRKPVVYLAGPIAGCNPDQIKHWRSRVKERWGDEFEVIDPADELDEARGDSPHAIVRRDEHAIRRADAVLANMWKESIGTAIGVVLARTKAKRVVVVDANRFNSHFLAYYADAVVESPDAGMKALRALLRAEESLKITLKRAGDEQPFDRKKLTDSIRAACRAAERDDILAPAVIAPRVLERLIESKRVTNGRVTTTQVREAVWSVLARLEADPARHEDFAGVREAWERYDRTRRDGTMLPLSPPRGVPVRREALDVRVYSGKSHASIWGKAIKKLHDIPARARRVFKEIARVEGIAEIRLTKKTSGPKLPGVRTEILASRDAGIIEGKCFDNARAGQVQMFQIRVHDADRTDDIRRELVRHLGGLGLLRDPGVNLEGTS